MFPIRFEMCYQVLSPSMCVLFKGYIHLDKDTMQVYLQYEADDCTQDSKSMSTSFQFYLPSVFVANRRKMLQSEAILRWESTQNLEGGTNPRWDLF